jgi:hypothetical protein
MSLIRGKVDRTAKNIEQTTVNSATLALASQFVEFFGITLFQVSSRVYANVPQVLGDAPPHTWDPPKIAKLTS